MIKVISIKTVEPYFLICEFNDKSIKRLDVLPLIEKHNNLNGIEKLKSIAVFKKVEIGELGEIFWRDLIQTSHNSKNYVWNYDISPEFAYNNSQLIN